MLHSLWAFIQSVPYVWKIYNCWLIAEFRNCWLNTKLWFYWKVLIGWSFYPDTKGFLGIRSFSQRYFIRTFIDFSVPQSFFLRLKGVTSGITPFDPDLDKLVQGLSQPFGTEPSSVRLILIFVLRNLLHMLNYKLEPSNFKELEFWIHKIQILAPPLTWYTSFRFDLELTRLYLPHVSH